MAMETPLSSTRRITRSLAAAQKSAAAAGSDSAALFSRAKNAAAVETQAQTRAALQDISNDSPIVGLAAGGLHATDKTPASTAAKTRRRAAPRRTPGSGEALLRGQVKALLHKVEEEQGCVGAAAAAALVRPARNQALLGVARSPAQLLAPTPANTAQIGPVSAPRDDLLQLDGAAVVPCVLDEEELLIPKLQVIAASLPPPQPEEKLVDCQLNRALVFDDSPEKSEESSGSAVSLQESSSTGSYMDKSSSPEDDSSSVWSTQVHASSEKGDEEELDTEELAAEYTEEEDEEDWEEDSDDDCYDDLCEEMSRMTVLDGEEKKKAAGMLQFEGKHTRFIYNSDDEIEREEVADAAEARAELGALMLRGLPVPQGRHLRFHDEDDEE